MSDMWKYAPEGTEYSYQGNWWKTVNGIMFRWERKKLTGSFDFGYHWARSPYIEELTEKMTPRPKDKPVYTQAMCDSGTLPLVGMECIVVDISLMNHEYEKCVILFIGIHKVVYTSESCIERFSNLDEVNFKPIEPPIELFNGRYYGFNYKDGLWCGIYNKDDNKFYFTDSFIVASHCTNITLLTPEVKS